MKFKAVQSKIAAALEALPFFSQNAIPVIAEDKGDVAALLQAALQKARRGVLVQTPGFRVTSKASKVMVGDASVVVQALESFVVNRSHGGPTAQDIAEVVAWSLNLLPVEGVGVLACQNIASELLDPQTLSYSVSFTVQTSLGDPLDNGKEEAV